MWFWRMLRKHWKMVEESGCRWTKKERTAERLQQKERGNPGVTASLLPKLPLRSVGGGRGREGGRDEEMKAGMRRWGKGQERERESEFRDRLIYEFLFLNHDVFREFNVVSHPSSSPSFCLSLSPALAFSLFFPLFSENTHTTRDCK